MPLATVQKITGPMIILTSLMKPSPSGLRLTAQWGAKYPSAMPIATAISTCV